MQFFTRRRYTLLISSAILLVGVFIVAQSKTNGLPLPSDIDSYDATVEKGQYLAIAGNCLTCHTAQYGKPFAGGLEFRTPFGTLYSTNITADEETGIGSWSFQEFYNSMKLGVRPDGAHLYPAFPYTAFAKMTDEDIASLYLYMRTVEPVNAEARPNDLRFPYNLRGLLYFWKALFHEPDTYQLVATQSDEWNRGAYLVEGLGHCGACHTPRNYLGAERKDIALSGGVYLDKVKTGRFRPWSAVNLTPADAGLGKWSEEDIVAYLKEGQTRHAVVHGPMNEVVMNSTRHLQTADLQAIAAYLKAIPPIENQAFEAPDEETLRRGEIVYTVHCGACHLPTGLGDGILGVALDDSAIVQTEDPASLINVILYGPHLPPPPFVNDRTRMKMFGKRLSDKDIANVASYVRSSFGNEAGVVRPEQVKAQR